MPFNNINVIDDVAILKANKSYLITEMEVTVLVEEFRKEGYQYFAEFDSSLEREQNARYVVDTLIKYSNKLLGPFKNIIENEKKLQNINLRLKDSRYVTGTKIGTCLCSR